VAQVAEEGDPTKDITKHWPEDRKIVELGMLTLNRVLAENDKEHHYIIFDPIHRVEGSESSDDPILDIMAGGYLISGKERRAAQ